MRITKSAVSFPRYRDTSDAATVAVSPTVYPGASSNVYRNQIVLVGVDEGVHVQRNERSRAKQAAAKQRVDDQS